MREYSSPLEASCRNTLLRSASVASDVIATSASSCSSSEFRAASRFMNASSVSAFSFRAERLRLGRTPPTGLSLPGMSLLQLLPDGRNVFLQVLDFVALATSQLPLLFLKRPSFLLQLLAHRDDGCPELGHFALGAAEFALHRGL